MSIALPSSVAASSSSTRRAPEVILWLQRPRLSPPSRGQLQDCNCNACVRVCLVPTMRTRVLQEGHSGSRYTATKHAATLPPAAWHRANFLIHNSKTHLHSSKGASATPLLQLPACLEQFNSNSSSPQQGSTVSEEMCRIVLGLESAA